LGMIKDRIYAMDSVCSHQGGPLEEGWLEDYDLICPWHQGILLIAGIGHPHLICLLP
ncbi:MAG: Rieske (2Fe-2S) protein, partial [Planctomycetes bacterium]|nr:Rieske (2Fe-2S) protein [Planctomycetota bacterium]